MTLEQMQTLRDFLEEQEAALIDKVGQQESSDLFLALEAAIRFAEEGDLDDPEGWPDPE